MKIALSEGQGKPNKASYKLLAVMISALVVSACDSGSNSSADTAMIVEESNAIGGSTDGTSAPTSSSVSGVITLMNIENPTNNLAISVRDTDITGTVQTNGEFTIELPVSDTERTLTLDISGDDVIPKSVVVHVPANSQEVQIDASVAARTPALTFNLADGGVLKNAQSPTSISVTVPANAFQLPDGSVATNEAKVSITEIDITDLYGDSYWAPGLMGIPAGSTEPTPIRTFGMADFHFTQNGQKLQLRPGMEATIAMDLISPFMMSTASDIVVDAVAGATMPLWHHDPADMLWKEEGFATISANDESASGFSASGNVSHFSTWNVDYVTPFVEATVVIELVDLFGRPRTELTVESYTIEARVPKEDGAAHGDDENLFGNDPEWISTKHLTPQNNRMQVLSNGENRQAAIDNPEHWVTDWLYMEFRTSNLMVKELGELSTAGTEPVRKLFRETDNDHTIVIEVVVPDA